VLAEHEAASVRAGVVARARRIEGVELVCWLERDVHGAAREAVIASASAELHFAPDGEWVDLRGATWSVDGALDVLGMEAREGRFQTPAYPDALSRVWSALRCANSGDVLLSAASGYEFLDWGGQAHIGGGSHGSLRVEDSLTALIMCGTRPPAHEPAQWNVCDLAALVTSHFGLVPEAPPSGPPVPAP
jgi:hypothetical protein